MPQLDTPPAESWARLMLRRTAGTVGAAVVLAGVGPAIANAAGANIANPVAMAMRASGDRLAQVFSEPEDCVTPEPSASPTYVEPSEEPSVDPSVDPSVEPSEAPEECVEPEPSPSESESESPEPAPSPTESEPEAEEGNHGQIVSTVAHCAPRGKDPLLDVEGAPGNHGGYVKVAAHGDTLSTPWGTFDLSTLAGAEALCAALDAARATTSPEPKVKKEKKEKKDKGNKGRPDWAGPK